jgi:hypothetical protein
VDLASLTSAQIIQGSAESFLAKTRCAGDHFIVGQHPKTSYGSGQVIRQFKPRNLAFFDLIVLASVVHDHKPRYSLLKNQCYWYSNLVYLVVEERYSSKRETADYSIVDEFESSRISPDSYLPDSAGQWNGFKVSDIPEDDVKVIEQKFEEERGSVISKVSFPANSFSNE